MADLRYGGHTHLFNGLLSRTTCTIQYQKGKTSRDLNKARDDEHMKQSKTYTQSQKYCIIDNDMCACDKIQMMSYIVNSCDNIKPVSADKHAINWLMSLGK